MLFNSYQFLLLFLPITYVVFLFGKRILGSHRFVIIWLTTASLFFYAWWNPIYLLLISSSVVLNYSMDRALTALDPKSYARRRKVLVVIGITANLGSIAWYKYANFFVDSSNAILETEIILSPIILPLAISFFTFQQIAHLIDVYRDPAKGEPSFLNYAFFVCFFPQLIAGPIVQHGQIVPQLNGPAFRNYRLSYFSEGISYFSMGLFKKVALADTFAVLADPVFAAASAGAPISMIEAWTGALGYTLQLYFDFSGYSDMAIGMGMMFGLRLPLNFNSPYKASNIIDFWRRWHMTLSHFLKDYLYIALGGNRAGAARRYANIAVTMLIGGLWHGAGWTFVFWGGLHGVYLMINHGWVAFTQRMGWSFVNPDYEGAPITTGNRIYRLACGALTFLAVIIAWVFFRASSFDAALAVLQSMAGLHALLLPPSYLDALASSPLSPALAGMGWRGGELVLLEWTLMRTVTLVLAGLAIVWLLPNTQQLFQRAQLLQPNRLKELSWHWRQNYAWSVATGLIAALSLSFVAGESEFLYFQF